MLQCRKLVFEFFAPDGFAARAITKRVPALDHEFLDHAVELGGIVIAVARMRHKVFYGFGRGVGKEADVDVAGGGVQDCCVAGLDWFGLD